MHGGMKFPVEANVMEKSDKNLPVEKHSSSIVHRCLTTASTHTVNNHSDVFKNKSSCVVVHHKKSLRDYHWAEMKTRTPLNMC